MIARQRIVFDTNTIISHMLFPGKVPDRAVQKVLLEGQIISSQETMQELADVLARPKFDRYISLADRISYFEALSRVVKDIPIIRTVKVCRDPKDDKFLALALNGEASMIVTGDKDLLELHPFLTVQIITPAQYIGEKH